MSREEVLMGRETRVPARRTTSLKLQAVRRQRLRDTARCFLRFKIKNSYKMDSFRLS